MTAFADALAVLGAAILFVGGVVLLGFGAIIYARAASAMLQARVHRVSADSHEETIEATQEAIDELYQRRAENRSREEYDRPTDQDLLEGILDQREVTTTDNEIRGQSPDEQPLIPPDRMFLTPEEAEA